MPCLQRADLKLDLQNAGETAAAPTSVCHRVDSSSRTTELANSREFVRRECPKNVRTRVQTHPYSLEQKDGQKHLCLRTLSQDGRGTEATHRSCLHSLSKGMHGGSIWSALSTEGVNAWLSPEALWPWPEKPPWVSRWVLRLLKALPEAVGLRDRRGTFLTLSVSLLQCGTDCQPAEKRHIETPTPHSISPPGRQQEPRRQDPGRTTQSSHRLTRKHPWRSDSSRWPALLPIGGWRRRPVL